MQRITREQENKIISAHKRGMRVSAIAERYFTIDMTPIKEKGKGMRADAVNALVSVREVLVRHGFIE